MPVELDFSPAERKLMEMARALRLEEDGKALKRDIVKQLRKAAQPVRQAVRASIRSAPTTGHAGRSIRSAIAQKTQVVAKLNGKAVGVRIVAKETGSLRNFRNAPRRFNSPLGWHHLTFGREPEVDQLGKPGWFDDTIADRKREFRTAVEEAVKEAAQRVARRVR
ncbi:hypothetical protein [Amycolatopsis eburnea]|uniref:HK97 gp10 family phage protein n=1 Tax=Amycolatopsis eburnea TaxID=2267691 RepID=A0A3R9FVW1_9PSEU|nr:hypothetical protein [Amycolatopsis eburnea]RSD26347.1 hypothetical protein EIY87_00340 [Amycolatopsis eburnea]